MEEEGLGKFKEVLGVGIDWVKVYKQDPPVYELSIEGVVVEIGPVDVLLSPAKFWRSSASHITPLYVNKTYGNINILDKNKPALSGFFYLARYLSRSNSINISMQCFAFSKSSIPFLSLNLVTYLIIVCCNGSRPFFMLYCIG